MKSFSVCKFLFQISSVRNALQVLKTTHQELYRPETHKIDCNNLLNKLSIQRTYYSFPRENLLNLGSMNARTGKGIFKIEL